MPSKEKDPAVPGRRDDGSFDLSDDLPVSEDELRDFELEPREVEVDADVHDHVQQLQAERDEAVEARQRALAELVNFRRRADENQVRARRDGTLSVIRSLLPALDQFDLALDQRPDETTVEQFQDGVRLVRNELHKALDGHDLAVIRPEAGEEFDPNRHQAVRKEPAGEQAPNTVVTVLQVGYAIGDAVLRPACVTVASDEGDE